MRHTVIVLAAIGCAATSTGRPAPLARADAASAAAAVENILADGVAALERGDIDFAPLLADAFSWGTGSRDVFTSREALARSPRGPKFSARNLERHVFVALDGRSAWFWETYERSERPVRHTGLAAEMAGKWLILAQHTSYAYGPDIDEKDRKGELPPLAPVGDGVASGAEELAALFRSVVFFDRMMAAATSPDFILLGTAADYIAGSVVRPVTRARDNGPRPQDGVRAGLSPSGGTGWAAANVVWMEGGKRTMGPMRFLFVFAKEGARWRVVQNHHSYAPE